MSAAADAVATKGGNIDLLRRVAAALDKAAYMHHAIEATADHLSDLVYAHGETKDQGQYEALLACIEKLDRAIGPTMDLVHRAMKEASSAAEVPTAMPAHEDDGSPATQSIASMIETLAEHRSYASSYLALQEVLIDVETSTPLFPSDPNHPGSLSQLGYALRRALKAELDGAERIESMIREASHV